MLLWALRLACPPHPPTAGHHPQLSGGALLLPAAGKGKPLKRQRSAQKKEAEDGEEEGGAEKGALCAAPAVPALRACFAVKAWLPTGQAVRCKWREGSTPVKWGLVRFGTLRARCSGRPLPSLPTQCPSPPPCPSRRPALADDNRGAGGIWKWIQRSEIGQEMEWDEEDEEEGAEGEARRREAAAKAKKRKKKGDGEGLLSFCGCRLHSHASCPATLARQWARIRNRGVSLASNEWAVDEAAS